MERRSLINAAMTAPIGFMAAGVMNVADAADSSSFAENVVWMPLKAGVTPSLCVDSMTTQADTVNMKQVGHLPLSKQVEMMLGKKQPLIEVFMFCNPLTAVKMVQANYAFGAYLPLPHHAARSQTARIGRGNAQSGPVDRPDPEKLTPFEGCAGCQHIAPEHPEGRGGRVTVMNPIRHAPFAADERCPSRRA